jgi:hypothetical protein
VSAYESQNNKRFEEYAHTGKKMKKIQLGKTLKRTPWLYPGLLQIESVGKLTTILLWSLLFFISLQIAQAT